MSVFDSLGIKHIYSNPYYPNSRKEDVHNFLKHTIAKFIYDRQLDQDDAPPAMYCYNITPFLADLESPFYLVHGRDPLEGILSDVQNCTLQPTQVNSSAGAEKPVEASCQIGHGV